MVPRLLEVDSEIAPRLLVVDSRRDDEDLVRVKGENHISGVGGGGMNNQQGNRLSAFEGWR